MKTAFSPAALVLAAAIAGGAWPALAETPQQILTGYVAEAARVSPGYAPSPERGRQFFLQRRTAHAAMPSCATCHGDNPTAPGRHAITNKVLEPLAPVAGSTRFTSPAKVEKWFRRNCGEVVGRECSVTEKADVLRYLITAVGV